MRRLLLVTAIACGCSQGASPASPKPLETAALPRLLTHVPADMVPAAPRLARHGFEIVDKRSGKEVYLDGSWAELFQQQITAWQLKTPTQEEVEDTLDRYSELAQNPVILH